MNLELEIPVIYDLVYTYDGMEIVSECYQFSGNFNMTSLVKSKINFKKLSDLMNFINITGSLRLKSYALEESCATFILQIDSNLTSTAIKDLADVVTYVVGSSTLDISPDRVQIEDSLSVKIKFFATNERRIKVRSCLT